MTRIIDSHLIDLTFWRIDIIKTSYINDCSTTIGETVEKYLCQERKVRYFKKQKKTNKLETPKLA